MNFLAAHKKHVALLLVGLAVALAAIGWYVLPDTLVMQLSFGGQAANTMSKPVGLLLPFGLTVIFALLFYGADKRQDQWKYFVVSLVGLLVYAFTFVVNLIVF